MRNDSIERSVNDSMLTIADSILQMIEQSKQKSLNKTSLMNQEKKRLKQDSTSWSTEKKTEAEYELYYAMIKEHHPQLFEIKGNYIETFPVDKEKSVFFILKDKDAYFGVYKQESKEAHIVTPVFPTKEDLLQKTLGTSQFEKFRMHSFFIVDNGKAFSLHDNKQLRLNLAKSYKTLTTYENIEQARTFIVKEELKNDPKLRKQSLRRALEEHFIPSDLLGKTVTIQNISNDGQGTRLSLVENQKERDVWLPDIAEKWMERVRDNPGMKVMFDEVIMDSRSIAEGFLAFYGMEINKEIQAKQHDFEVISNQVGSYIGKLSGNGKVKKVSPYFSEEEAEKQLGNLNNHIQLEKRKEIQVKEVETDIQFKEIREND
ncbi:hypothetical protein ACIQW7_25235 [Peribacillus simplex]|uniref:hypothetical protein n=1 Tax=Peribacillus simplex TaxID=1478 RepID=UPI003829952F